MNHLEILYDLTNFYMSTVYSENSSTARPIDKPLPRILFTHDDLHLFTEGSSTDKTSASFVRNYYTDRNVHQIVVFGCWDPYDYSRFAREVMQLDTKISYAKITKNLAMQKVLKVNYYAIGVLLDYDCPQSEIVFEEFTKNRLPFNESYQWLVLTETMKIPMEVLRRLPLTVETEITIAERQKNSYVLHDVYNPSYRHDGPLNVTFRGTWTPGDGLKDELTQYKYLRRGNFHGLALNFSLVLNSPALPDFETYITTPVNRHLDTMIRYHYALILKLRDTYNFTINLKQAKTWGYLLNGTWNGILADMIDGSVDISVAPFQYKASRMDVCEFTVETYVVRPIFIFRHPKKNNLRNPFLKPLNPEVWYVIGAVGAICYVILVLTAKVEKNRDDEKSDDAVNPRLPSEIDLMIFAAIAQQGTVVDPRIISGRIVFITLFLWGLLIFQFYSASIVGSLLAEQPRFITTVKDLTDSNIDVWIQDIVYYHDLFQIITDPDALELYDKKVKPTKNRPNGSYTNVVHGLNLVKKGGHAFHVETAIAYKIITDTFTEDEICDLQEIELTEPKKVSIVTSKKSPFRKMIVYGLRRMVQHGLTDALTKIWVAARPTCPDSHNMKPVPVQVEEFIPAIILLLIGLNSAIVVMILEYCYKNVHTRFRRSKFSRSSMDENVPELSGNMTKSDDESVNYEDLP